MDEKTREIEERLQHPMFLKEPGKHLQSGQARDDIKYLLSRIKKLQYAIDRHEIFKRTHERVVALEDEELYQERRNVK